jgi:hypothetical protein
MGEIVYKNEMVQLTKMSELIYSKKGYGTDSKIGAAISSICHHTGDFQILGE